MHEGFFPLHLVDLPDLAPRPGPVERRIRIYAKGYIAMKRRYLDDVLRSCSEVYAGAELCFDPATGFPATATVDDERTVYKEWAQFNGKSFPSRLALYRGNRLQMETITTVTRLDDRDGALFHELPRVEPSPNRIPAHRDDDYEILSRGHFNTFSYGEALVKVHVNEAGRVQHAEVIDADDKSLGKAALAAAKEVVYMPREIDGHRVSFDTTFWVDHWSTVDPLRIPATSLKSQGTD
jgi:TonB family protein